MGDGGDNEERGTDDEDVISTSAINGEVHMWETPAHGPSPPALLSSSQDRTRKATFSLTISATLTHTFTKPFRVLLVSLLCSERMHALLAAIQASVHIMDTAFTPSTKLSEVAGLPLYILTLANA